MSVLTETITEAYRDDDRSDVICYTDFGSGDVVLACDLILPGTDHVVRVEARDTPTTVRSDPLAFMRRFNEKCDAALHPVHPEPVEVAGRFSSRTLESPMFAFEASTDGRDWRPFCTVMDSCRKFPICDGEAAAVERAIQLMRRFPQLIIRPARVHNVNTWLASHIKVPTHDVPG